MRTLTLFAILLLATSAHAGPKRILTAIPRAIGRSVVNQFTCKDKSACFDQWLSSAATGADAWSTADALHREPGAIELNPLMHGRPSGVRISFTMLGINLLQNASIQAIHEKCAGQKCYGLDHLQAGMLTALHTFGAAYNSTH